MLCRLQYYNLYNYSQKVKKNHLKKAIAQYQEMILLKEAVKTEHEYYHLLSGMDLPIKSQDEIHQFFETYKGLEFVDEDLPQISEAALARVKYVHKFYGKAGSVKDILGALSSKGQKLLGVDKTKKYDGIIFQKGRNWFSITHGLAKLV